MGCSAGAARVEHREGEALTDDAETIRCRTCEGVAHPASGCAYSPTFIVCGPCTREAWKWLREMTASKGRRKGRPAFYDHVNRIAARIDVPEGPLTVAEAERLLVEGHRLQDALRPRIEKMKVPV